MSYALSQLGISYLSMKDGQKQSTCVVYERKDVFVFLCTLALARASVLCAPFFFDYKLGLIGGQKKSYVVV